MKLGAYLDREDMTDEAFARLVGVDRSIVTKWRNGSVPGPKNLLLIHQLTAGAVTPNDFLPDPEPAESAA